MANTNVTISKTKVSRMPLPEASSGFNLKFHVDYTDVNSGTGSGDTITMSLGSTPTGSWMVAQAIAVVTTAFAGTTAFTVIVGTTTSTNCILTSTSVMTAGVISNTNGVNSVNGVAASSGTTSIGLQATFTNATGGSPSALSAGSMDIFVALYDPTKLDGFLNNA